jgi:hypothetical protein
MGTAKLGGESGQRPSLLEDEMTVFDDSDLARQVAGADIQTSTSAKENDRLRAQRHKLLGALQELLTAVYSVRIFQPETTIRMGEASEAAGKAIREVEKEL